MRLPSFKHKQKPDSISEKPSPSIPAPAPVPTTVTVSDVDGHDSISLRIHNRTSVEILTLSTFGALHTGSGGAQRIASSSIPSSPNPDSGVGVFGVRNTPVRVPAGKQVEIPSVRIQAFTAAATSGYEVGLTLNPRTAKAGGGYSASLSAPAPTLASDVAVGRLWKPLPLTTNPTLATSAKSPILGSNSPREDTNSIYALQSTDLSTNTIHILLLPTRNLSTWMSILPSSDPLSSFCIPGTHESCALYGWPISACQESTSSIAVQLNRGIRFLDIRLALKGTPGKQLLYAYHGVTDQKIEFSAVLSQVYDFLVANAGETVLMSVKQENNMAGFLDSVFSYINQNPSKWYLGTGMPKLGDVRGKIVLISRFGSSDSQPGGIHPPIWPDSSNSPFNYTLPDGTTVMTQDWYNISSLSAIPTKLSLITTLLSSSGSDPAILGLNFTNGSSFPFALPPWVAKGTGDQTKAASGGGWLQNVGVNALLVDLVATRLKGGNAGAMRGGLMNVFALDFFDQNNLGADLASLMVEANFQ
ncbi:related to 1-phosphatidylinositol phosphodiesterase precursor [Ustilago trichophora]|uniref:Related to 1-phosphatidylinositol phosphodiesterase n=1 Tax=Ustilago trichophora TaxID=86804 RepID=A0A5C3EIX2_9BASI|nr:related to 1-phosphatidylinositol phosphodiesterase precursor [Ustilago trichophora]